MAQYSYFRRTGTNLKTAGVSPQVAWYGIATISCFLILLRKSGIVGTGVSHYIFTVPRHVYVAMVF